MECALCMPSEPCRSFSQATLTALQVSFYARVCNLCIALSPAYLAHHELEREFIISFIFTIVIIFINVIVTVIIVVIIIIIIVPCINPQPSS